MARFRFIGDPAHDFSGPDSIVLHGLVFGRIEWTDVPDDLAPKLDRNSHFEREADASSSQIVPLPRRRGRPPKNRAA
jgi:hypothetical protein